MNAAKDAFSRNSQKLNWTEFVLRVRIAEQFSSCARKTRQKVYDATNKTQLQPLFSFDLRAISACSCGFRLVAAVCASLCPLVAQLASKCQSSASVAILGLWSAKAAAPRTATKQKSSSEKANLSRNSRNSDFETFAKNQTFRVKTNNFRFNIRATQATNKQTRNYNSLRICVRGEICEADKS